MKAITLLPLLLAACSARAPAPVTATDSRAVTASSKWRETARRDVLSAFEQLRDNHPGSVDPENPAFGAQLARARDEGLRIADAASDREGYADALGAFSAGLSDGHALAGPKTPADERSAPREWPGFIAAFRGNKIVVHYADKSAPAPVGTEIVACNGIPVREYVRRRLAYQYFRPNEAGQWWSESPHAFASSASSVAGRARRCTFGTQDKALTWSTAPDNLGNLIREATDGERTPIELSEPRKNVFLIGLQNFQPNDEGVKAYESLFAKVDKRAPELARARAVVLDLRHNQGGSSVWSRQLAEVLWGKAVVDQRMSRYSASTHVAWRASQANIAHVEKLAGVIERQGNATTARRLLGIAGGLRRALADHVPLYVEPDADTDVADLTASTRLRAPVYVITPGVCASACLDALDVFTRFENVKLVGAPTSADSTYMEVRVEDLPSGEGLVVIPTKVYTGRPRASGQIYWPAIEVTDLDWSTKTFLDVIERDLERSRSMR